MSRERRREMVDRRHPALSTVRQCPLPGISRSSLNYRRKGTCPEDLVVMKAMYQQYLSTPFYGSRRVKTGEGLAGQAGSPGKPEAGPASDAGHGTTCHLPAAQDESARAQGVSLSPWRHGGHQTQSGVGRRHHLHPHGQGVLYLAAIMDWYSRCVAAWRLSNTLDADFCVEALEEALSTGTPEMFNTDQGSQSTGDGCTGLLERSGVRISMDGKGTVR